MELSKNQNTKLAQNTLFLYMRMLITTLVSLYTARLILQNLGASDFGITSLVGGIVSMLSFLNSGMVAATQRFLSYELGKGDYDSLKQTFRASLGIHVSISLIIIAILETLGLWYVNTHLNIDSDRMCAANWSFQASIVAFALSILSWPYNAAIVAHEKMSAFAYISLIEVLLKLIVVFVLSYVSYDKLIVYSILTMFVSLIIRGTYVRYCKMNFEECRLALSFDRSRYKQMISFAGWSLIGNLGFTLRDQVGNIFVNLFFNTSMNASRGIGVQVGQMISTFATNFTMAIMPQITKSYAAGDIYRSRQLVMVGSRITFLMLLLISMPILLNIQPLLELWLIEVPLFTSEFVKYSVYLGLIYSMSSCVTVAIQATGKIKAFQIGVCVLLLLELPFSWLLLYLNYPPYTIMYPSIVSYCIALIYRFYLLKKYVEGYSLFTYIKDVVLRCSLLYILCYYCCTYVNKYIAEISFYTIISLTINFFVTLSLCFVFGLNSQERCVVVSKIKKITKLR